LAKMPGQANVVVRGGQAFVATGQTRDVEGWVEPYLHAELTVDTKQQRLLSALVAPDVVDAPAPGAEAEVPAALDPRGSDLWLSEDSVDDESASAELSMVRVPVALGEDQSVLIASYHLVHVRNGVALAWAHDPETPWGGPVLVDGGL